MSLLRQLLLSVTLAILVILAGATISSVGSARQYLDAQLQAQSDSTATSLALTLSQPSNQDPTVRELLISVLFDSGQFQVVEFLDPTGRILIRREIEDGSDDRVTAPGWFSHLLPLERHEAQRQVTNGWTQLGVVRLQANDAYARNALWASTARIMPPAARSRMAEVKTAVLSLLMDAYQRRDRVGLVTFRGAGAQLALPPTSSVEAEIGRAHV